jgi:hypothetical protein
VTLPSKRPVDSHGDPTTDEPEEPLPSFSEQMAQQLGGVRGLIESSIPVTVFVVLNFLGSRFHWWSLRTALIASVAGALVMAGYRLVRREPVRHAINGVVGILIGAYLAWRSGEARDFYLPGIILTAGQAVAMIGSVVVRRPLVGWIWSVMFDGGARRWYEHKRLLATFGRLTVIWALVYAVKVAVQTGLYLAHQDNWLGISRLALGWPPYALLLGGTIWAVRRVRHSDPELQHERVS